MIKRFIIAAILLALVAGGLVGFNIFRQQMITQFFANMPRPSSPVSTVTVTATTWRPGIEAVGTALARQGVDVAPQASGVVKEILFKPNEKVTAGQTLVRLDTEVEQAELIAADASVRRDTQALERARALQGRGVSTQANLQDAQAQLDTSRSTLERIQATIRQKEIQAPFAGTIGIARIDLGQYIQPGTVIATLQDLDTMKVDFTVPEQQRDGVRIGQEVKFGSSPDKLDYTGKITGIDPKIDPASRLVSVQAEVANSEGQLSPGQFVNVRVELPAEPNVIALPQTAVISSLYGSYVYVVGKDDKAAAPAAPAADGAAAKPAMVARQVFVQTGRRNAEAIEIVSGLEAGAEVVTAGQNRLSSGAPVTIDNSMPLTTEGDAAKTGANGGSS